MKALYMKWESMCEVDLILALTALGIDHDSMPFSRKNARTDSVQQQAIEDKIREGGFDFVFSFNYWPVIALACKNTDTKYISWVYDSPVVLMYSYTAIFPTNYIFTFDKAQYMEFHSAGINTVYYLPLAVNVRRLDAMKDTLSYRKSKWSNKTDIAFVGSLYTEKNPFFQRLEGISDHTRGYIDGLIGAQKQVYGSNFIQETLEGNPEIMEDLMKNLPMNPDPEGVETSEYLFAQYVINREITARERREFVIDISRKYGMDLYSKDPDFDVPGCHNHGVVDYYDMAPYIFKNVKINLNISLRSIISGIPLRCFDIIGAGGFLLSNYQSDFDDCFVAGEDYVYFDSKNDMLDKIEYYLAHDDEREQIAAHGRQTALENHSFEARVPVMLEIAGLR